ncbi:uncharacterized protein LOC119417865 [Nematolebias whitei]|uniref:uncharacterized protein LOC119417865 n=1 Tax=Nematolebias whitei TaxID=451745 RepID=UPI00189AD961|nr:uncharacterized protein LOC119417865 [Nematolebias whitei]
MSTLLQKIRSLDSSAAICLEGADFRTDSDILTLTREELHELFPGRQNLKKRRAIYDTIHTQKSIHLLLKELQDFVPHESLKAALSNNGVLVDYLHILKDMKTQLNKVQSVIDAHIDLLEGINKAQPEQQQSQNKGATESCSSNLHKKQVKYKTVVSGKTFDAHLQILGRIKSSVHGLNLVDVEKYQTSEACQVTFVFCPNVSRVGTDIEAAMKEVTGSGPVVLVLMHHSHEAKHVASVKTWTENSQVLLHVNVFYHDKSNGLIACKENDEAISAIRDKLQSCFSY